MASQDRPTSRDETQVERWRNVPRIDVRTAPNVKLRTAFVARLRRLNSTRVMMQDAGFMNPIQLPTLG